MNASVRASPAKAPASAVGLPEHQRQDATSPKVGVDGARAMLRLQAATLSHSDLESAALGFTSELAVLCAAQRVSLGLLEKRAIRYVAGTAGTAEDLDKPTLDAIVAAMEESADQSAALSVPHAVDANRVLRAHHQLRKLTHGAVLTVPLVHAQEVIGAVSLEFDSPEADVVMAHALLEDASALFGGVFKVLLWPSLPWWKRIRSTSSTKTSKKRLWQWIMAVGAVVLIAASVVPLPAHIGAPARIEGEIQRQVVAPSSGFIKSVLVRPGDSVKAGQVLAELLDRDLQVDRNRALGEVLQHESAYSIAMAKSDRAAMMQAQAKLQEARAQIGLIDQQIERVQLTAPIDGQVLQGDLMQRIGSPVEKGQLLLTVAPKDAWRVVVEVDERDITAVQTGQRGALSLSSSPWASLPIEVVRITPMASALEGRSAFEVEARLLQAPGAEQLRAGQRGVARLSIDDAAPLPLWSRRLIEHAQRLWWRWAY